MRSTAIARGASFRPPGQTASFAYICRSSGRAGCWRSAVVRGTRWKHRGPPRRDRRHRQQRQGTGTGQGPASGTHTRRRHPRPGCTTALAARPCQGEPPDARNRAVCIFIPMVLRGSEPKGGGRQGRRPPCKTPRCAACRAARASPDGASRAPPNGCIPQKGAAALPRAGRVLPRPRHLAGTCRPCTYWPSCTSRTGVGVAMPSPLSNRTRLPSSSGANLGITRPSSCA